MKRLTKVVGISLLLSLGATLSINAFDDLNLFAPALSAKEKVCRGNAVELAYQILATVDTTLTHETFNIQSSIDQYHNQGCEAKLVKDALHGMSNGS